MVIFKISPLWEKPNEVEVNLRHNVKIILLNLKVVLGILYTRQSFRSQALQVPLVKLCAVYYPHPYEKSLQ